MSKQPCPDCGKPLPTGTTNGKCPTCLLSLGLAAALAPEFSRTLPSSAAPGDHIGRYKLLELIGEGGFGNVWMAEQQEPVRRKVALKLLKLGMDTREVVARFEAERQALAMMNHANIAQVLDAGATMSGRPFFVMELVAGIPITTFCDTHRLDTRQRIELFVLVCEAVQHAHQKGVIHRDLKPGNILVADINGQPVPKVIDFGVAKALEEPLTDKTFFTRYHQFLGTPAYMSPEQAGLGGLDVDTRSDIYSLGVLLYELLTGRTPFTNEQLQNAQLDEVLRVIREQEPPKPSTRLTEDLLADGLGRRTSTQPDESAPSRQRLQQLIGLLRGELDWIILKALDKDRARRYATANGFATDLRRYLSGETVTAAPPTLAYRLNKFARKNRIVIATGAAFAALLIAGILATAWQAVRATNSAQESKEQRNKAQSAQKSADINANETRRELYVARIRLAHQSWQEGNLEQAEKMLEASNPAAGQEDMRSFEWRYLRRLVRDESRLTFTNVYHKTAAGGLAAHGDTLIVGSGNTIRWLDLASQREARTLNLGTNFIRPWAVALNRPGQFAYCADSIKAFSSQGEPLLKADLIHKFCRVLALSWDGDLMASGDPWGQKVVKLWDTKTGAQIGNDLHFTSGITSLAFSPDAKYLVCGDLDTKIHVLETKTIRRIATLTNHTANVHRLVFDRTGTKLVSGSHDSHIQVWSFPDCTPLARLSGHQGAVADVAFSPDGLRLASGGTDHTLRLWDLTTPGKFTLLRGHRGGVLSVLFSQDGNELYSASDDGSVKVWTLPFAESDNVLGRSQWLSDVAFSPDGRLLAVGDHHAHSTVLWDLQSRTRLTNFQHTARFIGIRVAFSFSGAWLAAVGQDTNAQVWNVAKRQLVREFPMLHASRDACLAIHPSKPILAVAAMDIRFWDMETGARLKLLNEPPDQFVTTVAFSPDGEKVAIGMRSGRVYLWNLSLGQEPHIFEGHSADVLALCFSHDSCLLASGSVEGRITVFDVRQQRLVTHLEGHTRHVVDVTFTPDDKSLVSASWDGTVRFWYLANLQLTLRLTHDGGPINAAAFSPDGTLMATPGADGTVRLWPAVSRAEAGVSR